MNVKNLSV